MVLLNSEAHGGKNGQNEFIFWLSHNYYCAFFSSIHNYNINHYPWEEDSDFQVFARQTF